VANVWHIFSQYVDAKIKSISLFQATKADSAHTLTHRKLSMI